MNFKKILIHFLVALVMFSVLAYAVDYPFTPKANIDMQDFNITNVGEIDGNISWDTLDDYPPACSAGYYVSGLDGYVRVLRPAQYRPDECNHAPGKRACNPRSVEGKDRDLHAR